MTPDQQLAMAVLAAVLPDVRSLHTSEKAAAEHAEVTAELLEMRAQSPEASLTLRRALAERENEIAGDVDQAGSNSAAVWLAFVRACEERGLEPEDLSLQVVPDEIVNALKSAARRFVPDLPRIDDLARIIEGLWTELDAKGPRSW